jgi:hypothetical protein
MDVRTSETKNHAGTKTTRTTLKKVVLAFYAAVNISEWI